MPSAGQFFCRWRLLVAISDGSHCPTLLAGMSRTCCCVLSHCIGRHGILTCSIPDGVDLEHLVKVMSAEFLFCHVIIFPCRINKYLREDTTRLVNVLLFISPSPTTANVHGTFLPESVVMMLLIPSFLPQLLVSTLRKNFSCFFLFIYL